MPVHTNSGRATKWLEGGGFQDLDDSLTCLQWLQNFSVLGVATERPSCYATLRQGVDLPWSPPAGDTAATDTSLGQGSPGSSDTSVRQPPQREADYRMNRWVKPPYSYATLICMAMRASKKSKVTLAAIYSWITDNFCYYRHAEPSWQNSIRHNLSLNKCFMKVPRGKDEPGKGGFWKMDPEYDHMFVNGVFKRRRTATTRCSSQRRGSTHLVPQAGDRTSGPRHNRSRGPTAATKRKRRSESLLLTPEPNQLDLLKGDLDWGSEFDSTADSQASNFEDLDINVALRSLGCEMETSLQFGQPASRGRCCGHVSKQSDGGYVEGSAVPGEAAGSTPEVTQLGRVEEVTLYQDQPEAWEELKEELQATPLTLGHSFGFCDSFFLTDVLDPYL